MIAKCLLVLAAVVQIYAAECDRPTFVFQGCGSPDSFEGVTLIPYEGSYGTSNGDSDCSSDTESSAPVTKTLVAKNKYSVALKNCGPVPDKQIQVTTSYITAPLQEKPTIRLPCNIPPPKVISHTCTCYRTICKPRVHNQIVTIPSLQRYIETLHKPVVHKIQYQADAVNCFGNTGIQMIDVSSDGSVQNVKGTQTCEPPRVEAFEIPKVQTCEVPKYQTIELPKVQTFEMPKFESVEVPQCQNTEVQKFEFPKFETIELPKIQSYEIPRFETIEIPKAQSCEAPKYQTVEIPKYQTVEIPKTKSCDTPKFETFEIPKTQCFEIPKFQTFEMPKYETVETPKTETVEMPKYHIVEIPKYKPVETPKPKSSDTPKYQTVKISKVQSCEVPKFESFEVPKFQTVKIPKCFSFKTCRC